MLYDFKLGDKVHWVSKSRGEWTEKRGQIIEVVPRQHGVNLDKYKGKYDLTSFSRSNPRLHESYVIAVPMAGDKPKLYWARVNHLEPYEGELNG